MNLEFEWDNQKASRNFQKHGISFETAKTVFDDPLAYIFDDEWHSVGERREIIKTIACCWSVSLKEQNLSG